MYIYNNIYIIINNNICVCMRIICKFIILVIRDYVDSDVVLFPSFVGC